MYEEEDSWPIKCRECLNEFTEKIGRLKTDASVRCPECQLLHTYHREEFSLALAQAKKGGLDPWRNMVRLSKRT